MRRFFLALVVAAVFLYSFYHFLTTWPHPYNWMQVAIMVALGVVGFAALFEGFLFFRAALKEAVLCLRNWHRRGQRRRSQKIERRTGIAAKIISG